MVDNGTRIVLDDDIEINVTLGRMGVTKQPDRSYLGTLFYRNNDTGKTSMLARRGKTQREAFDLIKAAIKQIPTEELPF